MAHLCTAHLWANGCNASPVEPGWMPTFFVRFICPCGQLLLPVCPGAMLLFGYALCGVLALRAQHPGGLRVCFWSLSQGCVLLSLCATMMLALQFSRSGSSVHHEALGAVGLGLLAGVGLGPHRRLYACKATRMLPLFLSFVGIAPGHSRGLVPLTGRALLRTCKGCALQEISNHELQG